MRSSMPCGVGGVGLWSQWYLEHHDACSIDNILDNKLVEGLVLNVCTLSMCIKMLAENEYEYLVF